MTAPSLITADYHTHTRYSHGTGTIEENVQSAIACGLETIAIADHGPGQLAHGVRFAALQRQLEEIASIKEKYKNRIRVLSAIEANITGVDGSIDLPQAWRARFDVVLAGYHCTAVPEKKRDMLFLQLPALVAPKRIVRIMTQADIAAIAAGGLFAITHPGEYVPIDMASVAHAAAQAGTLIEINNKHPMAQPQLQEALAQGAMFLLSSDAHAPEHVGQVQRAYEAAMQAKIPPQRIVNLRKGG